MALKAIHTGISESAVPGTCNQTGNNATKFGWNTAEGRFLKIFILCAAFHLGWNDYQMAVGVRPDGKRDFPPEAEIWALVTATLPWAKPFMDSTRSLKGSTESPHDDFGSSHCQNKLIYFFTEKTGKRRCGIARRHPISAAQDIPGGLREVFLRCSVSILDRLKKRKTISQEEAREWGALPLKPNDVKPEENVLNMI